MNREEYKEMMQRVLDKNFETNTRFILSKNFIDSDHLDSIWYGGTVATIMAGCYEFDFEAFGPVVATLYDDNYEAVEYSEDLDNTGRFYHVFKNLVKDDNDLYEKAKDEVLLFYEENIYCLKVVKHDFANGTKTIVQEVNQNLGISANLSEAIKRFVEHASVIFKRDIFSKAEAGTEVFEKIFWQQVCVD